MPFSWERSGDWRCCCSFGGSKCTGLNWIPIKQGPVISSEWTKARLITGNPRYSNAHFGLTCNDQHSPSEFYGGMTLKDLWYRLINPSFSRHEIGKKSTSILIYISRKILWQMKKKPFGVLQKGMNVNF